MPENDGRSRVAQTLGVGCFTFIAGSSSGGMVAVLVAKIVGVLRHCAPTENNAPCDWHVYAGVGMVIGAVSLPAIALSRLYRPERPQSSPRG